MRNRGLYAFYSRLCAKCPSDRCSNATALGNSGLRCMGNRLRFQYFLNEASLVDSIAIGVSIGLNDRYRFATDCTRKRRFGEVMGGHARNARPRQMPLSVRYRTLDTGENPRFVCHIPASIADVRMSILLGGSCSLLDPVSGCGGACQARLLGLAGGWPVGFDENANTLRRHWFGK
jgi:hypothetical protein